MDFKPPPQMSLAGNVSENWRIWRQQFEIFMTASEALNKSHRVRIAMLLHCIGPDCVARFNNFDFAKFETKFSGLKRSVFSRYEFWKYTKPADTPFAQYLNTLQSLARPCSFKETDEMIRDKIVFSAHQTLKETILKQNDLTLEETVRICQSHEITAKEAKSMASPYQHPAEESDVNLLREDQDRVETAANSTQLFNRHARRSGSTATTVPNRTTLPVFANLELDFRPQPRLTALLNVNINNNSETEYTTLSVKTMNRSP
ncbi:hypothetical protein CAPTEDRAFT_214012 [Capitella teleta]|uniref:Retrotransposon gag domain-containing protein n=1 Tax=Capitella teleta TaxID=283909 RepID=R7TNM0_CAPTE|nr:hypothetical protein CAPTEDRAFT_214012 [Capitella teleta]|eukprot:ELT93141.1 hypothetical protein CAPTEDRAFT_214012 [Capitella teleta]